jgi:hypothetical protein
MRYPERIPYLLDSLQEIWEENPDWRFGQLLFNIGYFQPIDYGLTVQDPFHIEDDRLDKAIDRYHAKRRLDRRETMEVQVEKE